MNAKTVSLSNSEKLALLSNLSTMVNAGLTLAEAVQALLEDATGNLKFVLTGIEGDIIQGKPLHAALSKFPKIFDTVTVAIIKAAEESGTIDVVLKDVKNTLKKDIEFIDKIKTALTYPMVIFVVFIGVLLLLLTFVIPKIADVFLRLRVTLPLPTKILIAMSNIIIHYTVPTILVAVGLIGGLIILYKTKKQLLVSILLSMPYISSIAKQIDLTRFARSMYLLLVSAIPLYSALELTQAVAMKKEVRDAIIQARTFVGGGKRLADGLRGQKSIPSLMIKLIEIGERSGTLDKSMEDLSEYFDYQVTNTLQYLMTLLEPLILVFVGVIVGGMMMAIIAPIYNIIGQVGEFH
jgi:type II secretory pathway component PulF